MCKAFKSFILLHSDRLPDMNSAFNVIIPIIIDKNVDAIYRIWTSNNNVAKENFSTTNNILMCDYNYVFLFANIVLEKFPNTVAVKDINSKLSRWLSQAPDRKGGRKERLKGM
ncbi:uncharacterized protein LOC117181232 [Belonocnema kinseyi]|uniref:uncharacterized protein LOC117181232 n=1 Tax=Belonocnema kinseyi TaxID=2817044 RepID=UPI00143D3DC7|nr:uncharacterized protein LOC117181232 [Belonocnema kinseyi]